MRSFGVVSNLVFIIPVVVIGIVARNPCLLYKKAGNTDHGFGITWFCLQGLHKFLGLSRLIEATVAFFLADCFR